MTESVTWLADRSALTYLPTSPDRDIWAERIDRGLVHVAVPTMLEIGYSARSIPDWHTTMEDPPLSLTPVEYSTPAIERRAVEVQGILVERGHHRAPSVPDLLIAATAELAGLTVLHVDKDFALIADVTSQPVERLQVA